MNETKKKTSLIELTWSDVKENPISWSVAVLPWGAIEPHGEHLPYLTDSLLATAISKESIKKSFAGFCENYYDNFMMLPSMPIGVQNLGQVNKKFCINFSISTQMAILNDIVVSLMAQRVCKLVIINGHNGNDFKPIVRELAVKYPDFKIFVCDYLSLVNKLMKGKEDEYGVEFPDVDDHAAFTETSLMLYIYNELVDKTKMNTDKNVEWKEELGTSKDKSGLNGFWTPRNFDYASVNNRIGSLYGASSENGKKIFDTVTTEIAKGLVDVYTYDIGKPYFSNAFFDLFK